MSAFWRLLFLSFLAGASASMAKPACPAREAGRAYPWQNLDVMPGDNYAWIYVDVDKTGRTLRCRVGETDIADPETKFRLCLAFNEDWRGAPAASGDPEVRTIKRHFTMLGYNHQMADQKARKQYFKDHPDDRPECYPD